MKRISCLNIGWINRQRRFVTLHITSSCEIQMSLPSICPRKISAVMEWHENDSKIIILKVVRKLRKIQRRKTIIFLLTKWISSRIIKNIDAFMLGIFKCITLSCKTEDWYESWRFLKIAPQLIPWRSFGYDSLKMNRL